MSVILFSFKDVCHDYKLGGSVNMQVCFCACSCGTVGGVYKPAECPVTKSIMCRCAQAAKPVLTGTAPHWDHNGI